MSFQVHENLCRACLKENMLENVENNKQSIFEMYLFVTGFQIKGKYLIIVLQIFLKMTSNLILLLFYFRK